VLTARTQKQASGCGNGIVAPREARQIGRVVVHLPFDNMDAPIQSTMTVASTLLVSSYRVETVEWKQRWDRWSVGPSWCWGRTATAPFRRRNRGGSWSPS
jgi:hypothetical protein